ncbi:VirB3 family type IV secretion system protein [Aliirhizobium smilacinae]|uniref:Type IV secretion system protein VirB3 n=1 Tax=Aliirhizobium smilacinae TaxID=1395944 RepID=A0A5C4XRT5_9HYPH|nr:VirB3 family type IV secretion system protein [Rhizobium smilacinae]TNM65304.1 type IV secretion system protein VirB3 [Rhizobium smilacinae]
MDAQSEDKVVLTPLIVGLTRPPMLWGVPYMAVVIVIGVTVTAWLMTNHLAALGLSPLLYLLLFSLTASDSKFLDVLQVACRQTPGTPNRAFWGATSYGL